MGSLSFPYIFEERPRTRSERITNSIRTGANLDIICVWDLVGPKLVQSPLSMLICCRLDKLQVTLLLSFCPYKGSTK